VCVIDCIMKLSVCCEIPCDSSFVLNLTDPVKTFAVITLSASVTWKFVLM